MRDVHMHRACYIAMCVQKEAGNKIYMQYKNNKAMPAGAGERRTMMQVEFGGKIWTQMRIERNMAMLEK